MGRIGCSETSVSDHQSTLSNILSLNYNIFEFFFLVLPSCSLPKIGGSRFLRNIGQFYQTTRRHMQQHGNILMVTTVRATDLVYYIVLLQVA